jgi:hypothetical protein
MQKEKIKNQNRDLNSGRNIFVDRGYPIWLAHTSSHTPIWSAHSSSHMLIMKHELAML